MIALDTNVIVSWLLSPKSTILPDENQYWISIVVLAELVWVLRSRHKLPKSRIVSVLELLTDIRNITFANEKVVLIAIADFKSGKADFSDYLLMRDAEAAACLTTWTSDKAAAKHPGFTLHKG